jgi:hypothetical protein
LKSNSARQKVAFRDGSIALYVRITENGVSVQLKKLRVKVLKERQIIVPVEGEARDGVLVEWSAIELD